MIRRQYQEIGQRRERKLGLKGIILGCGLLVSLMLVVMNTREVDELSEESRLLLSAEDSLGGGAPLAMSLEAWEWRIFYPKRPGDKVSDARGRLKDIVKEVLKVAHAIGFKKKKSDVSQDRPEKRSDVYVNIGDPSVGLKYRGEEPGETAEAGVLLELKLRHRIEKINGVFSNRTYFLEDWDKLIRKPLGTNRGRDVVISILDEALREYTSLKTGSRGDRFLFDSEIEKQLEEARDSAQHDATFQKVPLVKVRYLDRVRLMSKSLGANFKFEVTSVQAGKEEWWSVAIEGPTEFLCSLFADVALSDPHIVEAIQKGEVIYAGYPEFIMVRNQAAKAGSN